MGKEHKYLMKQFYFHHRNATSIRQVINKAYSLMEASKTIQPHDQMDGFVALTKGHFPVFNKYPKFVVDYQVQEKDRIRQEELEYLKENSGTGSPVTGWANMLSDLQKSINDDKQSSCLVKKLISADALIYLRDFRNSSIDTLKHINADALFYAHDFRNSSIDAQNETLQKHEEAQWCRQQKLIPEAEDRRMRLIQEKESKLAEQRKWYRTTDTRPKFLQFYEEKGEIELKHLDLELPKKTFLRDQETGSAMQETDKKKGAVCTIPAKMTAVTEENNLTTTGKELLNSIERSRCAFDGKDLSLLHEVRLLRQKLAKDSRNKRPSFPAAQK